ncbi:MSHA pilin protein MshD [Oxalobacteraceae bacterium GrIS 1.11]
MSISYPGRRRCGLSLIELLVFIVIVSIGVLSILRVMNLTVSASADPLRRKQALLIAQAMLEEVEQARFTYCDPSDANFDTAANPAGCATTVENVGQEAAGPRPYDNVNDYVTAFGSPVPYTTDAGGTAFPAGYTAQVTIQPDAGLGPALGPKIAPVDATPANMEVLRITVAVSYGAGAGDNVVLDGYRTRYDPAPL